MTILLNLSLKNWKSPSKASALTTTALARKLAKKRWRWSWPNKKDWRPKIYNKTLSYSNQTTRGNFYRTAKVSRVSVIQPPDQKTKSLTGLRSMKTKNWPLPSSCQTCLHLKSNQAVVLLRTVKSLSPRETNNPLESAARWLSLGKTRRHKPKIDVKW